MDPLKHILVGATYSSSGDNAILSALHLARRFKARLSIVRVEDLSPATRMQYGALTWAQNERLMDLAARDELLLHLSRFNIDDLSLKPKLTRGDVVDRLSALASEDKADLVVVGNTFRSKLQRRLAGSVPDDLARTLTLPVYVAHAELVPRFKRICAAVDLSPISERVLDAAVTMSSVLSTQLEIAHADKELTSTQPPTTEGPHESFQLRVRQEALDKLGAFLEDRKWTQAPSMRLLPGQAGAALAAYTRKSKIDLLVMGGQKRSFVHNLVFGSTLQTVLQHAESAVLIIPSARRGDR